MVVFDRAKRGLSVSSNNFEVQLKQFDILQAEEVRASNPLIDADLSYFEEKTQGKRLPKRSDLDPNHFKATLPEIGLLAPVYDNEGQLTDMRALLMGTKLDHHYGPMTDKLISEHPHPDVFARIYAACERCIQTREPNVVIAETVSAQGNILEIKVLYIPMSENNDSIDRIFLHNQIGFKYSPNS